MCWGFLGHSDFVLNTIHEFLSRREHWTAMNSFYPLLLLDPFFYFSLIWKSGGINQDSLYDLNILLSSREILTLYGANDKEKEL